MAREEDDAPRHRKYEPVGWLRWVAAAFLACVAVASVFPAYGALSNLWADSQDSPPWVYVVFGGFFAILSAASLVGLALLRRRP